MIISVHNQNPGTPLDPHRPGIVRQQIGPHWVDFIGDEPTLAEVELARQPTPLEQIRSIERTLAVSDAMQRGSRLVALSYGLDDVVRAAAARGQTVTRQQAHAWAMVNDTNYKTLYDAEQVIKPLRDLV